MYGEKKVQSSQLTVVDAFQPSVNKLQPFQFQPRGQVNFWPILDLEKLEAFTKVRCDWPDLFSIYIYLKNEIVLFFEFSQSAQHGSVSYSIRLIQLDVSDEQRYSLNVLAALAGQFCGVVVRALTCNSRPALLISTKQEQ